MELRRWKPFGELEGLFSGRGLDGLFQNTADVEWRPAADIMESDSEYVIKADLPEVKRDDIDISVANGVITLSGERRQESRDETEQLRRVEKFYGSFTRSFALPSDIDEAGISASQEDGVLTVRLPKVDTPVETKKRIEVS